MKSVHENPKVTMKSSLVLLVLFFASSIKFNEALIHDPEIVHFMDPGEWVDNDKSGLRIFCHNAKSKYIINLWKTVIMTLKTNLESYELYEGSSPHEVVDKHEENQRYWRFNLFSSKKSKQFSINPFENSCIGVYMSPKGNQFKYKLIMTQNTIDLFKISLTAVGIFMFWYAKKLSRNTLFYYMSGISLGVTLSILILIYLLGKLFPKGKFMYLMVATGYTMSFYVAQILLENAQMIAMQYRDYVLYYILSTALISFIICYRIGPVTNTRTRNIIQWALQIAGLVCVYHSSYFREASTSLCILLLVLYNVPTIFYYKSRDYWKQMFPERRRLLTDDEYRKEAVIETKKALDGLQQFCHSPQCNPWKTVLTLKDPIRFARFMEGNSHLLENESMEHDAELTKLIDECDLTDDEEYDNSNFSF
ncbi:nuclear envelope integral membrane protein 1 isoform X1 [Trichogramma pretiosum]|uniref:nuclear envelope integral membrane protein 1 isoform X1 n=1 Tax=Trichogramma pretiosum TaxID=7493 RepID=UPI0006C94B08|nr:nuclear envelope integral membrane protein 1 isoform X1 [Trichogramma pretiosum]